MAKKKKAAKKRRPTRRPTRRPPKKQRTLSVEVSLSPPVGVPILSAFAAAERPRPENISRFYAAASQLERAVALLASLGFQVKGVSRLSISVECAPEVFQKVFGTQLEERRVRPEAPALAVFDSFLAPSAAATWTPPAPLEGLVERAYIQPPYLYFLSPVPPRVSYHHLRAPGDLAQLTNAARVHREGTTGRGVKVAMIDSGFFIEHPFYQRMGYNMSRILSPDADNIEHDENGHGTAEAANVLAIAPDATFIGVKAGANLTLAFKEAVKQNPDIITVSLGWDLRQGPLDPDPGLPLPQLPNTFKSIESEIADAVASGITVIFSAGNGHIGFPGMHPDVVSAGGAFVDESMDLQASDYASAFQSAIYPGRSVPDLAGLVGLQATAGAYIMLPLEPGCTIDQGAASNPTFKDGTKPDDGWCVISGTSAAAPQLAGVCALLKQKDPGLTPDDIKAVLERTAVDVAKGQANAIANPVKVGNQVKHVAIKAKGGPDGATGHGLVDALAAWKQV